MKLLKKLEPLLLVQLLSFSSIMIEDHTSRWNSVTIENLLLTVVTVVGKNY